MLPPMFKILFRSFKRPMDFIRPSAVGDAWLAGVCIDCGPQFSHGGGGVGGWGRRRGRGAESTGVRIVAKHNNFIIYRWNKYALLIFMYPFFTDVYWFD